MKKKYENALTNLFFCKVKHHLIFIFLCPLLLLNIFCKEKKKDDLASQPRYLNHLDTVKYMGMETCRQCHAGIYESFIKTGMGKSIDIATHTKSSGNFSLPIDVYDSINNFHYSSFWENDSMYIREERKGHYPFIREEKVSYIIGSGQHTNSHLMLKNGYLFQMPLTFYSQKNKWDLPPGFEKGQNTRFSRKIGYECMSCHNSYPKLVEGSENKYSEIPNGISCERCHGPGQAHVKLKMGGEIIDTSKYIDYSIVNPAKLPIDLQFDVCQRCHLQGNSVLKSGKNFDDFKPGLKLSDYMTVFLPKYKNAEDEFIMASHADRLKKSKCFSISIQKAKTIKSLRPYKNALTCVTCHNPHISVRETGNDVFNNACNKCHSAKLNNLCSEELVKRNSVKNNCVSCHMPQSGSIDIPHVSVHDHWIRKPIDKNQIAKTREFIGLFAINETAPDLITKAKAYIQQFEKFTSNDYYLDSAQNLLNKAKSDRNDYLDAITHLYFVKKEYQSLIQEIEKYNLNELLKSKLINVTKTNRDAWILYRIGEAYYQMGRLEKAETFFASSVILAPYILDFQNKLGSVQLKNGKISEAKKTFEFIFSQNKDFVQATSNLGFVYEQNGELLKAENLLILAIKIDPDYEQAWINLASIYFKTNRRKQAKYCISNILRINPKNKMALNAISNLY